MPDFGQALAAHLGKFHAAPFLFVGAGLSRRYLELDGWDALLRRMAELTGEDYDYYAATAEGDLPEIATLIARSLHDPWWHEARFKDTRERLKGKLKGKESALKAEASAYLVDSMRRLPKSGPLADELEVLRDVVVDGIITTNFDPLLEELFPAFEVFVGQDKLLFNETMGVGEIYKIHGSHEEPDSLVLTRADYDRFRERNAYLAAKLTTFFVEHPVVFIGYSLSDENVGAILHAIVKCLDSKESVKKLADRLIFVQWDEDSDGTFAPGVIRVDDMPIPVMTATVPEFHAVFEPMGSLRRRFPAKLLRQLKEEVYELVLEDDPRGKLHVLPLDPKDDPREAELVYGVGAIEQAKSYVGFSRDDLIDDVLRGDRGYLPARVAHETLPNVLTHPGNVPIYKYLREAGLLDESGELIDPKAVDKHVAKHASSRAKRLAVLGTFRARAKSATKQATTLKKLIPAEPPHVVLRYIPALDEAKLDPVELREFLLNHENFRSDSNRSQWVKMVCLYDWLRWGRQLKPKRRRRPRRKKTATV